MTPFDLKAILGAHALHLKGDPVGRRADLFGANLRGANLRGANLRGADLAGANLRGADLFGANLRGANLREANLGGANLTGANLTRADLAGANLAGAYLRGADLAGANLAGADLAGADLAGANLRGANLREANLGVANLTRADLRGADLTVANLTRADLRGADLPVFQLLPEEGSFIGWKRASDGVILKLQIQSNSARVSTLVGRKCRASSVKVLSAFVERGGAFEEVFEGTFRSMHDPEFKYIVGEKAVAPSFDPSIQIECTAGLHFFITKQEAIDYGG